jgi:outer membrane protein TolC
MKKTIIFLLTLLTVSLLNAEKTITLDEALKMARENNLSLKSTSNALESARWSYYNSLTQFLPSVNFSETAVINDKATIIELGPLGSIPMQPKKIYNTQFTVEQVLFTGGKIYSANRLSKLQYDMAQNAYSKALLETDSQVTEYYYTILKTLSTVEILNNHKTLCEDLRHNAQIMFRNGIGLETDVMQWELRIIEIENQLNNIENAIANLKEAWALALGIENLYDIPMPQVIDTAPILDEIRAFSVLENSVKSQQMQDFLNKVNEQNYDLQNLRKSEQSLTYVNRLAKANFMPTVFTSYTYTVEQDDKLDFKGDKTWQIMANISVPLFHSGRNFTNYKLQKYQLQSQKNTLDEATKGFNIQAKQYWYDFDSAVKNVLQSEKYTDLAERSLNINRNLYEQGRITIIALSDAQNSSLEARIQFINSVYDYINAKNKKNNLIGE